MTDAREALVEVAYMQIATEKMLTITPTGPGRASVPPHWRAEAEERAKPWIDAILAAGWTPPGERVQCDHERAAREMARVTPLRVEDTLRMIEAMVNLAPPTVQPSVEDVARQIDPEAFDFPEECAGDIEVATDAAARVLALLPGRTEAKVKAEAWDEGDAARWMYVENRRAGRHVTMPRNPYWREVRDG